MFGAVPLLFLRTCVALPESSCLLANAGEALPRTTATKPSATIFFIASHPFRERGVYQCKRKSGQKVPVVAILGHNRRSLGYCDEGVGGQGCGIRRGERQRRLKILTWNELRKFLNSSDC